MSIDISLLLDTVITINMAFYFHQLSKLCNLINNDKRVFIHSQLITLVSWLLFAWLLVVSIMISDDPELILSKHLMLILGSFIIGVNIAYIQVSSTSNKNRYEASLCDYYMYTLIGLFKYLFRF